MTDEERAESLKLAGTDGPAKWLEIERVRNCFLQLQQHALRLEEDLVRTWEDCEEHRQLYEALLRVPVRPRANVPPAQAPAGPEGNPEGGGGKPARQGRRKAKEGSEG